MEHEHVACAVAFHRDEQTPLLPVCAQLPSGAAPAPGPERGRELQTSRVSLETRPGKSTEMLSEMRSVTLIFHYMPVCLYAHIVDVLQVNNE